ncbi:MAG TPA: DUF6036 family nucleotidyltransferase [Pyrinomonadaceae bacterium]|nr:DUF6036 family nucleotidyltransferase [Pyrinomonadaceae bacterium]
MRQKVNAQRFDDFMRALASDVRQSARVFLVGGATAVLFGWRDSTVDVDIKIVPEHDEVVRKLPPLKERFQINIELAAPDDFIPPLPGWEDRSQFIKQEGKITFLHYDLYAQALAKIERWHDLDQFDVGKMFADKLIKPVILQELFDRIEDQLYRYPAIDADAFRNRVQMVVKRERED